MENEYYLIIFTKTKDDATVKMLNKYSENAIKKLKEELTSLEDEGLITNITVKLWR